VSLIWLGAGLVHAMPSDWPGYVFWLVFALLYIGDKDFSVKMR